LSEALKINRTVRELNLVGNNIGSEGAGALLEALKNNNTVTTLDLEGNNIGENNLQEIENLLERNRKMKDVYSGKNTNTDDIKMTLSFSLNRLKQKISNDEYNNKNKDEYFYRNIIFALGMHPFAS